jgi:hypothetical protein
MMPIVGDRHQNILGADTVLKITWNITTHTALCSATRMQQRSAKVSIEILQSISDFPPLSGAAVVPRALRSHVQCPFST